MEGMNLKNFLKSRKGVSQIIGSVFMLAVVAAIGSVILIQGIGDINTFTSFFITLLSLVNFLRMDSLKGFF